MIFQRLNTILRNNPLKRALSHKSGQAAIVLILVIAVALIFYAVAFNFGEYSQSKAQVSVASNTGASSLGSGMASYGELFSQTQLRGRRKICAWSGIFAAIIAIIIIIVSIILLQPEGVLLALAIIGLALAVVALVLQIAVIQPGITKAWNRIIQRTMSLSDQFTEGAIQTALQKIATDTIEVPDVLDADGDRKWVRSPASLPPYEDTISRFAAYYSDRLLKIRAAATTDIAAFRDALEEFVHDGTDDWGIHDPIPFSKCIGTSECHPCCMEDSAIVEAEDFSGNIVTENFTGLRADFCNDGSTNWQIECGILSPYGAAYPWVYDPFFENPFNNYPGNPTHPDRFLSLRETIGKDDEHRDFYKHTRLTSPTANWDPNRVPQNQHVSGDEAFYLEDATQFYVLPHYAPDIPENRPGLYPFFHKMNDWGVDLANLGVPANPLSPGTWAKPKECHWCDPRDTTNCIACLPEGPHPQPVAIPQLALPLDPNTPADGLIYNTTYWVDGVGNSVDTANPTNPPLAVDKVLRPDNIIARDDICAENTVYPFSNPNEGFWKEGLDNYCSTNWPYNGDCAKHAGTCDGLPNNCGCGENPGTPPEDFPDDAFDNLVIGLGFFLEWAENFLFKANNDINNLAENFVDWYPEAAEWIEPLSPGPPTVPNTTPSGLPCFLCDQLRPPGDRLPDEGHLHIFLKQMTEMRDRIIEWGTNSGAGYVGTGCTEAWCVPDGTRAACPEIPLDEYDTFTFNTNNNIRGDVGDIVGCLSYNVDGYDHVAAKAFRRCRANCDAASCNPGVTLPLVKLDGVTPYAYPPGGSPPPADCSGGSIDPWNISMLFNLANAYRAPGTGGGNDLRFGRCAQTCSFLDCYKLPRSMVPPATYNPRAYETANQGITPLGGTFDDWFYQLTAVRNCVLNCSPENCAIGPRLPVGPPPGVPGGPYPYPTVPLDCSAWRPGNIWYNFLVTNGVAILNAIKPFEQFYPFFTRCYNDCNTNLVDCVIISVANLGWTNWPTPFTAADCNAATGRPISPWDTDIETILANPAIGGDALCDLSPGGWLNQTGQSAIEATNQVAKFEKRRDFLDERLQEGINILTILNEAIVQFQDFLTGPAADLIQARIDFDPNDDGLPYQAVYGWQDEAKPGEARGKWHIVKVEARLPGNCDDACGINQRPGSDPPWPRVRSYTRSWGTKRCYELVNTSGVVKFRTTRYDEEWASGRILTFPNGVPIWSYKTSHPTRDSTGLDPAPLDSSICATSRITQFSDGVSAGNIYDGAFMMNEYIGTGSEANFQCWNLAHNLLTLGVVDETCAQYQWLNGRMDFRFVPCQEF